MHNGFMCELIFQLFCSLQRIIICSFLFICWTLLQADLSHQYYTMLQWTLKWLLLF